MTLGHTENEADPGNITIGFGAVRRMPMANTSDYFRSRTPTELYIVSLLSFRIMHSSITRTWAFGRKLMLNIIGLRACALFTDPSIEDWSVASIHCPKFDFRLLRYGSFLPVRFTGTEEDCTRHIP